MVLENSGEAITSPPLKVGQAIVGVPSCELHRGLVAHGRQRLALVFYYSSTFFKRFYRFRYVIFSCSPRAYTSFFCWVDISVKHFLNI